VTPLRVVARLLERVESHPIQYPHFRARLLDRHAVFQAGHQLERRSIAGRASRSWHERRHRRRHPHVRRRPDLKAEERGRCDANHRCLDTGQHDPATQHRAIEIELSLPVGPTDDRDAGSRRRGPIVPWCNEPPDRRLHTDCGEKRSGDVLALHGLDITTVSRQLEARGRHADQIREHVVVIAKMLVHTRCEEIHPRVARVLPRELHQSFGLLDRQIAQHQRVNHAEHRGVRGDAQRQQQHDDNGESRRSAQHAGAVPQVAPAPIEYRFPANVTNAIFHRLDAAQLNARGANRLRPRQPRSHLFFDSGGEKLAQLVLQFRFDAGGPEQAPHSPGEARQDRHHNSPRDASRIRAIALVCTSQSRVSRLSVARPAGVRR
jgi:hypothetical protein